MNKQFPDINTERLLLRKFIDEDINYVYRGLSHPDVIKYYGISFNSLEDTKVQMNWFADLEKESSGIWWAICSNDNKTFYGGGGLNDVNHEESKAEIGFWLLPEHWGKGIMKEALPLILTYGFNSLGLNRIEGFVETNNKNCKNALEKIDFNYERTMKGCEIKNGKLISLDIYSKLR